MVAKTTLDPRLIRFIRNAFLGVYSAIPISVRPVLAVTGLG